MAPMAAKEIPNFISFFKNMNLLNLGQDGWGRDSS